MKYQIRCKKCGKVIGDFATWFKQDQQCACGSTYAEVEYFDPWVPRFRKKALTMESIPALTPEALEQADIVLVTTAHTNVDYELVQKHAKLVFDTKNAMKNVASRDNIEVL